MPFEPLGTDEPREESNTPRRAKSFENELVGGCFTILGGSVLIFLLTWWPFMTGDTLTLERLLGAVGFALVPVLIAGAVMTRLAELTGAIAFAAGMFAGAMFLFLNLNINFAGANSPDAPRPDYPDVWRWIVPLAWFLVGLVVMLFAYGNPGRNTEGQG